MIEPIFKLLEIFASNIVDNLFQAYASENVKDYFKRRKADSAKRQAIDHVLENLSHFLHLNYQKSRVD